MVVVVVAVLFVIVVAVIVDVSVPERGSSVSFFPTTSSSQLLRIACRAALESDINFSKIKTRNIYLF